MPCCRPYNGVMSDRRPQLDALLAKARSLPRSPGVYLMKDAQGRVIYVGKASRLPDRVSSYFVPSAKRSGNLGPKKVGMLDVIEDFDFIECEGEWEAVLAESRLIKDIRPKFNERQTDDKTFPYLVITTRDDFPGVYITRTPNDEQYRGGRVLGPFTSVYALRESIAMLQRVFRFRTCHLEIVDADDTRRFFRPCLLYPIKQCTAPCAAKISKADYRRDIDRLVRFLGSKRSDMIRELKSEMQAASEQQNYEQAAILRDQILAIEKLDERGSRRHGWQPETESLAFDPSKGLASLQRALDCEHPIRCMECIDIAHLQGGETVGSKVCFVDGRPLKSQYRRYRIRMADGSDAPQHCAADSTSDEPPNQAAGQLAQPTTGGDDYAAIQQVVQRRYRDAGEGNELYPDLIIIDGGLGQLHAAMEALHGMDHQPPMVISLAKKEELIYTQAKSKPIKLGRENPGLKLVQAIRDEAHRFAQHYHHILRRKKVMGEK